MFEQASYVEKGLDPRVGRLLSSAEIPRVETAVWVLILLRGLESKPLDLETTLVQKEALLRAVTRRYMQPRKIWHPRGILGAGFSSVVFRQVVNSAS